MFTEANIFPASEERKIVAVCAEAEWEILAVNDLDEDIATPVILDARVYVRTRGAVLFPEKIKNRIHQSTGPMERGLDAELAAHWLPGTRSTAKRCDQRLG